MVNTDEKYMRRCFELALLGKGHVSPNPMVGCVVLDKNGKLIAEGYHRKYGENHAERDALLKLNNNEAEGGTLYVNLEPCSHYGKTPPCVDLIIERKIKRVVIGMKDVNPKVDGISKLKSAGIDIDFVLEDESKNFNRVFLKNMQSKTPYIVLKTATTMDGKIATKTGDSKWITSDVSRKLVYEMRKEFDCIMTSSNTVIADNPKMEHSIKCVLDTNYRTDINSQIYKQGDVYLATCKDNDYAKTIISPNKNGHVDVGYVLEELYKKGVCTIWLECGGILAGSLLKEGFVDEIYQFVAPKITNDNNSKSCFDGNSIAKISESVNLKIYDVQLINPDILIKSIVMN